MSCAAFLALVLSVVSVSAQTDPRSVVLETVENVSPAIGVGTSLDLSLRSHDDWALVNHDSQTPLDLSPRSHDDWSVDSR